jgi:hypothetical protein
MKLQLRPKKPMPLLLVIRMLRNVHLIVQKLVVKLKKLPDNAL